MLNNSRGGKATNATMTILNKRDIFCVFPYSYYDVGVNSFIFHFHCNIFDQVNGENVWLGGS